VCFNPEALARAAIPGGKPFRDLIVQSALEGVESAYKREAQTVKLSEGRKGLESKSSQEHCTWHCMFTIYRCI
jgi:hypothetical protein